MRKRLVPIYSVLVVAIVLLAVLVPSCGGPTTGTVEVKATLCGVPWQGPVSYTLTLAGGTSPISGTSVPTNHSGVATGTWTCAYVSGGPAGAFLNSTRPSATQGLSANGIVTFTLDFELDQDAAIEWLTWTVDGVLAPSSVIATPFHVIDVHFHQWVEGCEGYQVAVNETSWLKITQTMGPPAQIVVVNDLCAVNKTVDQAPPPAKKSQVPSFNGVPTEKGAYEYLAPDVALDLDVETAWDLVKGANYTKSIDWLGISVGAPAPNQCVLFELVLPASGVYQFTLVASAEVALVDDEDVDPNNNLAMSLALDLTVNVP
jgi:hypothetical protein